MKRNLFISFILLILIIFEVIKVVEVATISARIDSLTPWVLKR